jgi:L-ornithine N5-oxygenase
MQGDPKQNVHDIIGIGFGPANIALAIALQECDPDCDVLFLERLSFVTWQPGMLLDRADIQNHPLRDLVTPRNPRSPYTFINYLHCHDRLFDFLNLGVQFPLRKDFAKYISWVASHFTNLLRFDNEVTRIQFSNTESGEPIYRIKTATGALYYARTLVVAPGRTPNIPAVFGNLLGPRVFHLTEYRDKMDALLSRSDTERIAVIGGSQSAIEMVLDLSLRRSNMTVVNILRGFGYRLKDTSPFSEEVFFPSFVDYFYTASETSRQKLCELLRSTNYSSADRDVIHELYMKLYEQKLDKKDAIQLKTNRQVMTAERRGTQIEMTLREVHQGTVEHLAVDAVVLGTGFCDLGQSPDGETSVPLLAEIEHRFARSASGTLTVNRDYSLKPRDAGDNHSPIYLNGLCERTHGFGDAGSFSLLSVRSWEIATSTKERREAVLKVPLNAVASSAASNARRRQL